MKKAINIKMNSKFVLVSLIAVLTAVMLGAFASAATNVVADSLGLTNEYIEIDRTQDTGTVAVVAGETLPLEFWFTANENASDVFVSAWIQGHRSDRVEFERNYDYIDGKTYKERFEKGLEPESYDKEPLRIWFKERGFSGKGKIPKMPPEFIAKMSMLYMSIFEKITGKKFTHDFSQPILERITNNLRKL